MKGDKKVVVRMRQEGDEAKIIVDGTEDAVTTATMLFLGMMSWYEVEEPKIAIVHEALAKAIKEAKGLEDGT